MNFPATRLICWECTLIGAVQKIFQNKTSFVSDRSSYVDFTEFLWKSEEIMSLPAVLNRHSTSGFCKFWKNLLKIEMKSLLWNVRQEGKIYVKLYFYFSDKAPVSKVILGSLSISHVGLNLGMFSHFQKYLVCKMPGKYFLKLKQFRCFDEIFVKCFRFHNQRWILASVQLQNCIFGNKRYHFLFGISVLF